MPELPSGDDHTVAHPFLVGGGEAARIIASFDWTATSVGPIESWPSSRKATIALVLRSPVPIVTLWGEDGVMIYNDAYSAFAGGRHPQLFGSKVREGWPEVADFNDNIMKVVLGGGTLAYREHVLTLLRHGAPENVWLDLDYSPILDESGRPAGVIAIVVETTAKVRAERSLQHERENLKHMFEQAPGLIAMLVGPSHVVAMANAACRRFVGDREIVGRPIAEAVPEIVEQGFGATLDQAYRSGEPYVGRGVRLVLQAAGAEPQERYLDFVYQPVLADDGSVSGLFVQAHDVTEQKLAENALRQSEERFRLVGENAPVMLWMSDAAGMCDYLNATQRAFWAVEPAGAADFDWTATVHPDDRGEVERVVGAAMQARRPFQAQMRLRRADGAYRFIRSNAHPRFGPRGEFLGMIGVNVDLTEARQAEESLRQETRVSAILNRTGAAIAAELDLDKLVQMVTDAGVELIGAQFGAFFYNLVDEMGERYMLYSLSGVPREDFDRFPAPRATTVFRPTFEGTGIVRSDDILADPRYGHNAPYRGMPEGHLPVRSYLAVPVTSRSGEVLGGLFFGHAEPGLFQAEHETLLAGIAGQAAIAIDNARLFQAAGQELRERQRAEEALQALNATLEQRVADEVAERSKAEDALRQSQKMEAIGNLTGGVAHDFNNLLQVVLGNLQLLARDVAGNARAERRIANSLAGISRGSKLASQLLAFGRRQPLEPKVLSIGRLITGMADLLRRTLGEEIEVETIISGGLWNTFVDPAQLENALLNLAINSRDAIDGAGKLTIEAGNAYLDDAYVQAHPEIAAGQYVAVAVSDTGSGMSAEVMAQAFEPFFSTKPPDRGTGLGLSMVYGFVKQSGGHVKIYSEPGEGTTIKLYLPRSFQSEDIKAQPSAGPVTGGTETILVAEDDEAVRATVVDMLGELGYRVLTARDAESALNVIESGIPVDLLFTDVVMPGSLKSPELARKARERLPAIAVLFTSGYTENSIVHGGRLDPGVELLSKPYTREALARKIQHVLGASGKRKPGQGAAAEPVQAPVPPPAPRRSVLVCEDDALIAMATADQLRDAGFDVAEAGSGREALAALRRGAVDIVVIDVGLPDMSGVELAREIRRLHAVTPIIFATGRDVAPAIADLPRAAVVLKPYDEKELLRRIKELLG